MVEYRPRTTDHRPQTTDRRVGAVAPNRPLSGLRSLNSQPSSQPRSLAHPSTPALSLPAVSPSNPLLGLSSFYLHPSNFYHAPGLQTPSSRLHAPSSNRFKTGCRALKLGTRLEQGRKSCRPRDSPLFYPLACPPRKQPSVFEPPVSEQNLSSFIWSVADLLRGDYKQRPTSSLRKEPWPNAPSDYFRVEPLLLG